MIRRPKFLAAFLFSISLCALTAQAQDTYKPAPENIAARQSFQDDKFGLFIH